MILKYSEPQYLLFLNSVPNVFLIVMYGVFTYACILKSCTHVVCLERTL